MMSKTLKIAIAEHNAVNRKILCHVLKLKAPFDPVVGAPTDKALLQLLWQKKIDVLLIAPHATAINERLILETVKSMYPHIRVLILGEQPLPEQLDIYQQQAHGFISRLDNVETLFAAITAVSRGERYFESPARTLGDSPVSGKE